MRANFRLQCKSAGVSLALYNMVCYPLRMRRSDVILALMISLVWGLNFIVTKLVVSGWLSFDGVPPLCVAALRFVVVGVVLAPLLRPVPKRIWPLVRVGLSIGAVHFGLLFVGLTMASASASAIAVQMMPPFVLILSALMLGERPGFMRIVGVIIAFLGVGVIGYDPDSFSLELGVVFVVAAAGCAALASVWMKQLDPIGPLRLQAWLALVSAPPLLVCSMVFETGQVAAIIDGGWGFWAGLGYIVFLSSLFGHAGYFHLLRRYEASLVAPTFLLVPVWGLAAGVTLLGDPFGWRLGLGAALAILGVLAVVAPPIPDRFRPRVFRRTGGDRPHDPCPLDAAPVKVPSDG